jgi:hypothetical protein
LVVQLLNLLPMHNYVPIALRQRRPVAPDYGRSRATQIISENYVPGGECGALVLLVIHLRGGGHSSDLSQ